MNKFLKIFFIIAILTTDISILNAQSITWQKVLNYTDNSILYKVHQTRDNGYIAIGDNRIVGFRKLFLVKFNKFGDTLWNKYFDLSINSVYGGLWIEEAIDRGFILTGYGAGLNSDAYLIKTDSSGNIEWLKTFGGSSIDQGKCVKQLSDRGFILLIRTASYNSTNDIMLIRTDSTGNEIWRKVYGSNTYHEFGMEIQVTGNSGFIIAGWKQLTGQPSYLYLIRTDSNGDSLWTKTYNSFFASAAYSIDLSNNNGFIVGGIADSTNSNYPLSYVVKVDSVGTIEWQKRYSSAHKEYCFSIRRLPKNRYVFCGKSDSSNFNFERAVLRIIDGSGNELIEKFYRAGIDENVFQSIESTIDQGFVLCGYATFGNPLSFIVKTDSLGNVIPEGIDNGIEVLKDFTLSQNFPNPFNYQTIIRYSILKAAKVKISLYDVTGKLISVLLSETKSNGNYSYVFNAEKYNLSSGIYYYNLTSTSKDNKHFKMNTLKMIYLK